MIATVYDLATLRRGCHLRYRRLSECPTFCLLSKHDDRLRDACWEALDILQRIFRCLLVLVNGLRELTICEEWCGELYIVARQLTESGIYAPSLLEP